MGFYATNIGFFAMFFAEKYEIELFDEFLRRCGLFRGARKEFLCTGNQVKKGLI